ncbi:MAG: FxLYD domain-containing protein [Acidobacteriia bacterium]|nr:FxLYD domain-containing protein [Terriglobia bacterium]
MAAVKPNTKTEEAKLAIPIPLVVGAVIVFLGLGAWGFLGYWERTHPPAPAVLTPEAKQYVRNLQLSDVEIKATESYMKQKVVEITGKITNNGPRPINVVEINCVFHDAYGQVVLRERVAIVGRRTGTLAPGDKKTFRLAFDTIPESWNQGMPDLVIAQIVFV